MKNVTVTLSEDQYSYLQELAIAQNKTDADVLIKALATECKIYELYKTDADILVNDKKSIKQLVFFTDANISSKEATFVKYEQLIKELSLKDKQIEIVCNNDEVVKLNKVETQILFELLTEGLTKNFDIKYYLNQITATKKRWD